MQICADILDSACLAQHNGGCSSFSLDSEFLNFKLISFCKLFQVISSWPLRCGFLWRLCGFSPWTWLLWLAFLAFLGFLCLVGRAQCYATLHLMVMHSYHNHRKDTDSKNNGNSNGTTTITTMTASAHTHTRTKEGQNVHNKTLGKPPKSNTFLGVVFATTPQPRLNRKHNRNSNTFQQQSKQMQQQYW